MTQKFEQLEPISVNVPTAARLLGIGVRQVWQMLESGKLPRCRFGRRTVIPYSALKVLIVSMSNSVDN